MQIRIVLNKVTMELKLVPPVSHSNKLFKRKGFSSPEMVRDPNSYVSHMPIFAPKLVYEAAKLSHNGVCAYKVFENCYHFPTKSSLSNLLSSCIKGSESMTELVKSYKEATDDIQRNEINMQAIQLFSQDEYDRYLTFTRQSRRLNSAQSRKVRQMSERLSFYSQSRTFTSSKSGSYKMKVAFLTLTTPSTASPAQSLAAFETFLNYLSRTANCHYVWKKELGDENHHLHYHLIINNFIPYYLVNWKWKRALIAEGVVWPSGSDGKDANAHYRIEIPKSKKQTASYIAKYLSKAYDLPGSYGYIAGWSRILTELKEIVITEGDSLHQSLYSLVRNVKCICRDFTSFYCIDLLSCKDQSAEIFELFEQHYIKWSNLITLPQKFFTVQTN